MQAQVAMTQREGVIVRVLFNPAWSEEYTILNGVRAYARKHALNWQVTSYPIRDDTHAAKRLRHIHSDVLIGRRTDWQTLRLPANCQVVNWNMGDEVSRGDASVCFDIHSLGRVVVEYMLSIGVRSFALRTSYIDHLVPSMRARREAFAQSVDKAGYDVRFVETRHESRQHYLQNLAEFCQALPRPIGFFAYHDKVAEGLVDDLLDIGLSVPEDAVVIGGSGNALSAQMTVPLTTVRLPFAALGYAAAGQAHRLLSGSQAAMVTVPVMSICERTTSLPRAHHGDKILDVVYKRIHAGDQPIPSVAELAGVCHMRRQRLFEYFRSTFGCSPESWLKERAMQRASHLLAETTYPMPEIAQRCGIADRSNLSRRFKRRFGLSPAAYRRHVQQCLAR